MLTAYTPRLPGRRAVDRSTSREGPVTVGAPHVGDSWRSDSPDEVGLHGRPRVHGRGRGRSTRCRQAADSPDRHAVS